MTKPLIPLAQHSAIAANGLDTAAATRKTWTAPLVIAASSPSRAAKSDMKSVEDHFGDSFAYSS